MAEVNRIFRFIVPTLIIGLLMGFGSKEALWSTEPVEIQGPTGPQGIQGLSSDALLTSEQIAMLQGWEVNWTGSYPTGNYPYGICFDGTNIWVADNDDNAASYILVT